jgi:hypothetical protein
MASTQQLLDALDERLLAAIASASITSDTILKLAEARAWLERPDQAHGAPSSPA